MATILSHKYKLIFCHIPRTAGTSFTEAIRPYLGKEDEIDTFEKHTPLKVLLRGRFSDIFKEYTKVTIVRDPKSRFKSLAVSPPINTNADDEYWWPDNRWLRDENGKMLADVLLKFEELPDCAIKFLNSIEVNCRTFPHLNKR